MEDVMAKVLIGLRGVTAYRLDNTREVWSSECVSGKSREVPRDRCRQWLDTQAICAGVQIDVSM